MSHDEFQPPRRSWPTKLADALRGGWDGVRGQSSFYVHLLAAGAVVALAACCRVSRTDWCLLVLCVFSVLAAEMFNSCLETISRAISSKYDPHLARALNTASAAVLTMSIGAAIVGGIIFLNALRR